MKIETIYPNGLFSSRCIYTYEQALKLYPYALDENPMLDLMTLGYVDLSRGYVLFLPLIYKGMHLKEVE